MRGITDPMARQYWREYQKVCRDGNPSGLSFVEYVAQRVIAVGVAIAQTYTDGTEWHVATCGHQHPWGYSCNTWTST